VHDGRQQDDGQDYHDHPEEEHDDAGDCISRYGSRSSHGCQLPAAARLIQPSRRVARHGTSLGAFAAGLGAKDSHYLDVHVRHSHALVTSRLTTGRWSDAAGSSVLNLVQMALSR
jgi:hypothetical protein